MPGVPSLCNQYVDVGLPVVMVLLALVLLLAAVRLGREPHAWGPIVAVGVMAGIVAAFGAAYAVVGISTSDQQPPSPGLVTILIATVPILVAFASAVVLGRAYQHRGDPIPDHVTLSTQGGGAKSRRSTIRTSLAAAFVVADVYAFIAGGYSTLALGAPGVGDVGWASNVLLGEALTILPIGYLLCLWGSTLGLRLAAICAGASIVFAFVASVALAVGGPHVDPIGFALLAVPGLAMAVGIVLMHRESSRSTEASNAGDVGA